MIGEVINLAEKVGGNFELTQGSGGNISFKKGEVLWIKASGMQMKNSRHESFFSHVDMKRAFRAFRAQEKDVVELLLNDKGPIPSIETWMHLVVPNKVVLHLHPIAVLAAVACKGWQTYIPASSGWHAVEYISPGWELAIAICELHLSDLKSNVVLLGNHGMVVGGNTVSEVANRLEEVVSFFEQITCNASKAFFKEIPIQRQGSFLLEGYEIINNGSLHQLAKNSDIIDKMLEGWVLYPDVAVFLGASPVICASENQFSKFKIEVKRKKPAFAFFREHFVYQRKTNTELVIEQMYCLAEVFKRQPKDTQLNRISLADAKALIQRPDEQLRMRK
jgi:rhamnose utilization protein RhaD (predicted bifunctional aldolase and dehydrogenase)